MSEYFNGVSAGRLALAQSVLQKIRNGRSSLDLIRYLETIIEIEEERQAYELPEPPKPRMRKSNWEGMA